MPKKSLGQHWLFDKPTLEEIVKAAGLKPSDVVLEVGPGLGTLTELLITKAKQVVAVEKDEQLANDLNRRFSVGNLEVIADDILNYDLRQLPKNYKVVANIPYYLTSNLIRRLLEAANPPKLMLLLLQKEVAERIAAPPGEMSILSFSVQYYSEPKVVGNVPKELFEPSPKVDSAIIQINRRRHPYFEADRSRLFRLVKAGFGEKRKQLKNALAGGSHITPGNAAKVLESAKLKPAARAQELNLDDWHRLYLATLQSQII